MSKMLAIIAAVALSLCAALLGGAWALGGENIFHDPRSMEGLKPLIDLAMRKEWRWAGGDTLALDAPMTIRYQPQGAPNVTITGPADAMDHVRFGAGRISSDAPAAPRQRARLQAVVSGIPIRKFVVNGGETLQLGHVDQEELVLHINGNGAVTGDGKVRTLVLAMNGAGRADLGALQVGDASISLLGNGRVTLSPHGAVSLFAAGSGRVSLLTRPASIQRSVLGSARIETPPASTAIPTPPAPEREVEAREAPDRAGGATPMPMPAPMPMPRAATVPEQIVMNGDDNRNLGHIDQERLSLMLNGAGSVKAEGRVDTLDLHISGAGNANLGKLTARHVTVFSDASGNATIAPLEDARINLLGSGNVFLKTRPRQIEQNVTGEGRVRDAR